MTPIIAEPPAAPAETIARSPYTKKDLASDQPTWCPGCGDFSVLANYLRLCEERQIPREKIVIVAGIGCSSRFPYFVNVHGVHYIHGRAVPFATGAKLARPDLHVVLFGGDGDAYSIGGNHIDHAARKNVDLKYIVMDNFVYGLTKMQTSPTSPLGFRSKTDPSGSLDQPINPLKKVIAAGATFVARSSAHQPKHMIDMMGRAMDHKGFAVVEVLSECTEFYRGAFDAANPRKGGQFRLLEDLGHDATDELAAYRCAGEPFPGYFGVFLQIARPTKDEQEQGLIRAAQAKHGSSPVEHVRRLIERLR